MNYLQSFIAFACDFKSDRICFRSANFVITLRLTSFYSGYDGGAIVICFVDLELTTFINHSATSNYLERILSFYFHLGNLDWCTLTAADFDCP